MDTVQKGANKVINGVDLKKLNQTILAINEDPDRALFRFHAHNDWLEGPRSRTTFVKVEGGEEVITKERPFVFESDEPEILLGQDSAPNSIMAVLHALARAATQPSEDGLRGTIQLALEWLTGLRILKKHREVLGVSFRLDTVESKTQALRDLVFCCSGAQLFNGLYLLLDELEKQDYSFSKTVVLRYLLAIRALIDALPKHLFLLVALTTEARRRYFSMLPAFAGRLQNIVRIDPIKTPEVAVNLSAFYLREARGRAEREIGQDRGKGGKVVDPVPEEEVRRIFGDLLRRAAAEKAQEGVTPRDFLNALYQQAESAIAALG